MTVSITPSSSSNKILFSGCLYLAGSGSESNYRLKRGSTIIGQSSTMADDADGSFAHGGGSRYAGHSFAFLDSPKYKFYYIFNRMEIHSGTTYLNRTWDSGMVSWSIICHSNGGISMTGKIKLVHSGGNAVSLAVPTSNPSSSEVEFKLPQADGTSGQALVTDASGNLSFAGTGVKFFKLFITKTDTAIISITKFSRYIWIICFNTNPVLHQIKIFVWENIRV